MRINPFDIIAFNISIVVIYYVKNKVKKTLAHKLLHTSQHLAYYCCPIKPLYTAISSLNPAEIGMISSYFKFQAPLE